MLRCFARSLSCSGDSSGRLTDPYRRRKEILGDNTIDAGEQLLEKNQLYRNKVSVSLSEKVTGNLKLTRVTASE